MDNMAPPDGSWRRGLVMLTGGLGGLLGLGAQDAGVASRLTRAPTAPHRPPAPTPSVTSFQRGHWEHAVAQVQTDTAAHSEGFFTQVGAAGGELGGQAASDCPGSQAASDCPGSQAASDCPGSQAAATLLVTIKRLH